MGVYIQGMEMPTNCDMCWALDDYGDYPRCRITEEQRGYNFPIREKRMDNCPLVPVPEHGDLLKVLKIERACVSRDCDRDCGKCDLSLERDEILTVYDALISMLSDPAKEERK